MSMGEMIGKFTSGTSALSGCGRDCDALLATDTAGSWNQSAVL